MHIRKYDIDYGRRKLMEKTAKGAGSVGVLSSMWPMIAKSASPSIQMAYPDEMMSLEAQSGGKVNTGDDIDASNVEHVKHLMDEILYWEVANDGKVLHTQKPVTEITELMEEPFLEGTLKNFNANVVEDKNCWRGSKPQLAKGGLLFPEPKTAFEAHANINYAWGRHNYSQYAIPNTNLGADGEVQYQYELLWAELQVTVRPDWQVWDGREDKLRYQSVVFTSPASTAGTSFLNIWYYDQRKYPDLVGYLPAFRRVREYPTKQRFEPLVPGITVFLSNAWAAGDPMATWGNYKLIGRQPMLGAMSRDFHHTKDNPNWKPNLHGGPKGQTYFEQWHEVVPEVLVYDMEPTGYPRAPVGKRRIWLDPRNGQVVAAIDYDRNMKAWKGTHAGFSKYYGHKTGLGNEPWSWRWYEAHDIQSGRQSLLFQGKEIAGGFETKWDTDNDAAYNRFLTVQAMTRLGA